MTPDSPLPLPNRDIHPTPIDREAATLAAPGRQIEGSGAMIGPYKLLQKLGEGGMGQVWVADQEHPVKRRVAIKVIKVGMDTEQVIARFGAERQALAMMDHTNIARVLDAGQTNAGRPYFVMELVKGVPITKYCDELHLTLRERLKLFIPVCQAIQHAHQKGVIHRDIKPGNVLVCMQDGQPVPKVIDFGLAKALGHKLSEHTMVTQFGAVVGTLEYMSPEQAELSALDIDTRADVYALGVMLYELLIGTTPLSAAQVKTAAFDEVLRYIREQEPARPSTRLSESKDTIQAVAALRKTEPLRLTHDLRGDLDWIVMKCLEKDRTRRYDAAAALARDVERFLTDEPVEARPPSFVYQTQKFVRKNRFGITIGSSVLAILIVATVISLWQAIRATTAEAAAKENEKKALESEQKAVKQQQIAETNEKLAKENEHLAKESTAAAEKARENETASLKKQIEFAQTELSSRKQAYALVEVLETVFDPENNDRESTDILPRLKEKIVQIVDTADKAEAADPALRGRLRRALGGALMGFDDYDRAIIEYKKAVEASASVSGPESQETLNARNRLGLALLSARRREEAKETLDDVYAIRLRTLGPDHADTLVSLHNIAWYLQQTGDPEPAIAKYQEIIDRYRKQKGEESPELASTMVALGICYRQCGMAPKAVEIGQQALMLREKLHGPEDWRTLQAKYNLAWAHGDAGNADMSIKLYEELVTVRRKINGPQHSLTLEAMNDLAWAYGVKRDFPKAIAKYEEVFAKRREIRGYDDPKSLQTQGYLAQIYDTAGMPEKALPLFADLCERMKRTLGPDTPIAWESDNNYALACDHAGQHEQAGRLYEGVLASKRKKLRPDDNFITVAINNLGNHYYETNQFDKALPLHQEAYERDVKQWGADHRETLRVKANVGMTLGKLNRHAESIDTLSDALKRQLAISSPSHEQTLSFMSALADVYQAKGDLADSLKLNEQIAKTREEKDGLGQSVTLARWRTVRWQRAGLGDKRGALEVAIKIHDQAVKTLGERDPTTMMDLTYVADMREAIGEPAVAEPMRRAHLEFIQTQPTSPFMTPIVKTSLARNLMQQQKFRDALPLLEEVVNGYYRKSLPGNVVQYSVSLLLARCYIEEAKFDDGEKLLLESVEGLIKHNSAEVADAMASLVDLYTRWKKPEETQKWQAKLEEFKKTTAPTNPPK